jgi:hypothetical protein
MQGGREGVCDKSSPGFWRFVISSLPDSFCMNLFTSQILSQTDKYLGHVGKKSDESTFHCCCQHCSCGGSDIWLIVIKLTFNIELYPVRIRASLCVLCVTREWSRVRPPHPLQNQGAVGHDHAGGEIVRQQVVLKKKMFNWKTEKLKNCKTVKLKSCKTKYIRFHAAHMRSRSRHEKSCNPVMGQQVS